MIARVSAEQYKTFQSSRTESNDELYTLVSAYKKSFDQVEQALHDYLMEGSKYMGSPVQYVNYMISTMIESVMRLLYRFVFKDSTPFHEAIEIKFRDKTIEVAGKMYDNFLPL